MQFPGVNDCLVGLCQLHGLIVARSIPFRHEIPASFVRGSHTQPSGMSCRATAAGPLLFHFTKGMTL